MCFSSGASFGVSAALLAGGVASVKQVRNPRQIPFASIPLIFSVQQFCEGMIWLSFSNNAYADRGKIFVYIFLVFAQIIWPTWVPLSMWLLENNRNRKSVLAILLVSGITASSYLAYCLFQYAVHTDVGSHHIRYDIGSAGINVNYIAVLYCLPTILSPLVCTLNKMWIVGVVLLASFLVTKILFGEYVISVWCFFAAGISLGIFYIMKHLHRG